MDKIKDKIIVYIGEKRGNSLSRFEALKNIYKNAFHVSYHHMYDDKLNKLLRVLNKNKFYEKCSQYVYDEIRKINPSIVWVEKGIEIDNEVISFMSKKGIFLINSYSDNFLSMNTSNYSGFYNKSIPYYNIIFSPRDSDFSDYFKYGAKKISKYWKGFDEKKISPVKRNGEKYDCIFAGHAEKNRISDMRNIYIDNDINCHVYGDGWKNANIPFASPGLNFEDYAHVYEKTYIGLNYFSKWNKDTQNSRLFEIPGSRSLLISEGSDDAIDCYSPDIEAVFFSSYDEMIDKIKFYRKNNSLREKIIEKGYYKSVNNYTNLHRMKKMLMLINDML